MVCQFASAELLSWLQCTIASVENLIFVDENQLSLPTVDGGPPTWLTRTWFHTEFWLGLVDFLQLGNTVLPNEGSCIVDQGQGVWEGSLAAPLQACSPSIQDALAGKEATRQGEKTNKAGDSDHGTAPHIQLPAH
jgi:hypothetical protein